MEAMIPAFAEPSHVGSHRNCTKRPGSGHTFSPLLSVKVKETVRLHPSVQEWGVCEQGRAEG